MFCNTNILGKRKRHDEAWWPIKLMKLSHGTGATITPTASDTESEDNPTVELEKEEEIIMESILCETKSGCSVEKGLDYITACQKMIFPVTDENRGPPLLVQEVSKMNLEELEEMEIEDRIKAIEETKNELLQSICDESKTEFDITWKMDKCRIDQEWKKHVESMIKDWKKTGVESELVEQEIKNARITSKLIVVSIEFGILVGLIRGEFKVYTRPNGHVAIWGQLPKVLRKFYCIGSIRKWKLNGRTRDIDVYNKSNYLVRTTFQDVKRLLLIVFHFTHLLAPLFSNLPGRSNEWRYCQMF